MNKKDDDGKKDFFDGKKYYIENAFKERHIGFTNLIADIEEYDVGIQNVRWIKSKNYEVIE